MTRPVFFLLFLLAALACDRPRPAEHPPAAVQDSAAAADTVSADSVMARDTARQRPGR